LRGRNCVRQPRSALLPVVDQGSRSAINDWIFWQVP
jgi:hypothetical protein